MNCEQMIEQARELLRAVGMDDERSNERSALTLLALARLQPGDSWDQATNEMYTTRQVMDWIEQAFDKHYAANTRETIRRFTLHQFIAGAIVEENADRPDRPINSPKWNYRLTPGFLHVIQALGSAEFDSELNSFLHGIETWREQQEETRKLNLVTVTMPDETTAQLSSGGQNILIKDMVEEFCPRFAPGGEVLYIDDTDHTHRDNQSRLKEIIGLEMPERGKAPDLIVWREDVNWLYLMEACSTHGPIDVIRKRELLDLFPLENMGIIFVSCFPDRRTMQKYLKDLAWETEAWCEADPDHMIHLDGERFMGPYDV